jgi:hypothetical protein
MKIKVRFAEEEGGFKNGNISGWEREVGKVTDGIVFIGPNVLEAV